MEQFIDPYLEIKIQKVLRYLPCSDCGDCEVGECFAFAQALINDHSLVCPHLSPREHQLLFLLINYKDFLYPLARRFIKETKPKQSSLVGLIRVGNPLDKNAPIILTSNLLYEQSILNLLLDKADISCYLLAIDTHGISTGEALLTGKLSIYAIKKAFDESRLDELVDHKFLIIPRFGNYLAKSLEKISHWTIFPGPVHVSELPIFIERKWYGRLFKLDSSNIYRILKLMPERNDCRDCGYDNCQTFLLELQQNKVQLERCPILSTEPYKYIRKWVENWFQLVRKYETGVNLDTTRCVGCGVCTQVCPVNVLLLEQKAPHGSLPLFKIINGSANVINYEECWRHKFLIPCQICKNNCPYGAISFGPISVYLEPTQPVTKVSQNVK
ncbi:MAG: 4Fe-4S binding protein [Candidatus Helarchaeota archaeon]